MQGAIKTHIGEAVVTAALASQMRANARLRIIHLSSLRHPAQPSNLLLPHGASHRHAGAKTKIL